MMFGDIRIECTDPQAMLRVLEKEARRVATIPKLEVKVRVLFACRWFVVGVLTPPKGSRSLFWVW